MSMTHANEHSHRDDGILSAIVRIFLESNLSSMLILFALIVGAVALFVTPREEDPQIIVPLADIYVQAPGRSAVEVEQLIATPLERILYQIDGVEYVYSMSRENQAIITVRFYVGEDRERSLVKIFKKLDEHADLVPPGVTGWVVKPVEIDDAPIVTLTLTGADSHTLRRVGEEAVQRLSSVADVSRAFVIGGEPRVVRIEPDPDRLQAYGLSLLELRRALAGANITMPAGDFARLDTVARVDAGLNLSQASQLSELVVGVDQDRPVFLTDVAALIDGADELTSYVRHGWGPAQGFAAEPGDPSTLIGDEPPSNPDTVSLPAVTIAIAKKKGSNAVAVARNVLDAAVHLQRNVLPDNVQMVVTRNYGRTADEKVNELIEALAVAVLIVIALLTLSLGWRAAIVVAVAVPVVFGLTLAVNLLFGYTINRVTLFALILALGLLVDDPIVDVENIERHFHLRKKASPRIVMEAVAEIRPPLISATLAVIVSFLPMFFITGMMGPYMAPMALIVPVAMFLSMVVAFTITPWLSYRLLRHTAGSATSESAEVAGQAPEAHESYDPDELKRTRLYRLFRPLMGPLITSRRRASVFLLLMTLLTVTAMGLAATRSVPLKMLPYDNKNELLLVLDADEGTTLERTDAAVREFEVYLAGVPEVTDFISYVGTPGPVDFNGLVRHYYLREAPHLAEIRVNLVAKKHRSQQSHGIALRLRDDLTALAQKHRLALKIVELPPGPPVLASVVAEVYGRPDHHYDDLLAASRIVAERFRREPGLSDVDDVIETAAAKFVFVVDQEKAALAGVSVADIADTIQIALGGDRQSTLHQESERNPLRLVLRLPRWQRSHPADLGLLQVKGSRGQLVPLAELGRWEKMRTDQTIYHKNLERVAYVFAETAGRPPAECVVDLIADQTELRAPGPPGGFVADAPARVISERTYFHNGGGIPWAVPEGIHVRFSGEGEWKITLDVFRDLGLAFGAALLMIYVILVAQTHSFLVPLIVMLAIPLTVLGVMPGFYVLSGLFGQTVGGYADPVYFTATAMIGMIALSGIVTRDSIILVDFIQHSVKRGRTLFDAIMESRIVRLRPILLTAGAAMLSSIPITLDPIFSGLGWSLIFGLLASTLFTLFVVPVTYWLIFLRTEKTTTD